MRVIGVTGGVGAGKSTVLGILEEDFQAYVIQADQLGHILMEPGEECYDAVIALFGKEIIKKDKTIDRRRISDVVFTDKDMLLKLNGIIHPAVKQRILDLLGEQKEAGREICVVEAALFLEENYQEFCDEVWYVYTEEEIRIRRLMESRGYSREKSLGIIRNHVLVDVGISGKSIEKGLNSLDLTGKDVDGILITHEHSDHIKGLGVISRKYGIPIYTTGGTADAMLRMKSLGKMPEGLIHEIREDEPFEIKDLTVNPFTISHDAAQPVGYRLECGEHSVGIATDLGKYNDYIVKNLENLDAVLLEANHDIRMLQVGKYKQRILGDRGHLSNENAGRLLCRILHDNLKAVFLGHLSRENNYEELAYETVCSEVTLGDNPYRSRDFKIQVAKRDHISEIITV